MVRSSKIFKRELAILEKMLVRYASIKEEIAKREASKTNRLFHNLVTINAHALQEFYLMVPQERLAASGNFSAQKDLIKARLKTDPDGAAVLFLRELKNETAIKTELSVFRKLYDPSPVLRPQSHPIHKVILNVVNLFFQDLADNDIRVYIERTAIHLHVDYEALHVALYHLMDNACKYVMPESEIRISFTSSASRVCVIYDMYSLFVAPDERKRIFEDEYSGAQAKRSGKAGSGLGMGLTRDLLRLNGGQLSITWGELDMIGRAQSSDPPYARNSFVLSFPIELASQVNVTV